MYNVLDLFSGCGGMSYGMDQVDGLRVRVANEFDASACSTFRDNHPECNLVEGSITDPAIRDIIVQQSLDNDVKVVIGGIPCQAFSNAGKRDPFDNRGQLYLDYFDIVKRVNPYICVIENVKGLASMRHFESDAIPEEVLKEIKTNYNTKGMTSGKLLKTYNKYTFSVVDRWVDMFNDLGYNAEMRILKASDYGVPQHRERVIIIASKGCVIFPKKTHNESGVDGLKRWATVRDAINDLKDLEEDVEFAHQFRRYTNDKTTPQKIKNTKYGDSYSGYGEANQKCHPDRPCNTVKENHGAVFTHYEKGRHMTVRELARLQSFPDEFMFKCNKGQAFKQIGNAVPCLLGMAIGESCLKIMFKDFMDGVDK